MRKLRFVSFSFSFLFIRTRGHCDESVSMQSHDGHLSLSLFPFDCGVIVQKGWGVNRYRERFERWNDYGISFFWMLHGVFFVSLFSFHFESTYMTFLDTLTQRFQYSPHPISLELPRRRRGYLYGGSVSSICLFAKRTTTSEGNINERIKITAKGPVERSYLLRMKNKYHQKFWHL